MSRTGRQPIPVPNNVQVQVDGAHVTAKGPLGELEHRAVPEVTVEYDADARQVSVSRNAETRRARQMHGLQRTLIANIVEGVSTGFSKGLEIYGTGYNVNLRGRDVVLQLGFCHEVVFEIPEGVTVEIEQNAAQIDRPARFAVKGCDKVLVGQFAATIRAVRPPEPYKGKGVRYSGEYVRRKEGKALAGMER
jgi:large subunit ribosomal protein L6